MAPDAEIPERPPSPVILEAQKYVRARIERRWFVMFKETNSYQERHKTPNVAEMVEDMVMKRRLQRSEAAWKASFLNINNVLNMNCINDFDLLSFIAYSNIAFSHKVCCKSSVQPLLFF